MAANFKVFVDGNRLPAEEINNFLAKQCVVQVDGQNDLAPLTEYGVRMAMTLDTGALWFYTDLGGWSPLDIDGLLTLDEADARYLTQITAEGLFLTKTEGADFLTGDEIATTYLAKLTAEGLYLTQTDAELNYLGKTEAAQTYLTQLSAQGLYITSSDANNTFLTQSEANNLYLTPQDANSTYLTLIGAGQIYLSQTDASNTYITSASAGSLFISKGGAAGDINANSTTIDGGKITTGTISASAISAGVFTGFTIQTASSGQRVVMDGTNTLKFYNSSNQNVGTLYGGANMFYNTSGIHSLSVNGSAVLSINSSGIALSPGAGFNSDIPASGNITAGGSIQSDTFIRSNRDGTPATLHSNGGISAGSGISPGAGQIIAADYISSGGVVQVTKMNSSTTNPIVRWNGNQFTRTALTFGGTSDIRIKDNITPLEDALTKVNQLNTVTFRSKLIDEDDQNRVGLIAQEVEAINFYDVPLVSEMPTEGMDNLPEDFVGDNIKLINYEAFTPILIKAVQELSAKNEELEARLAALEGGNG